MKTVILKKTIKSHEGQGIFNALGKDVEVSIVVTTLAFSQL